MEELVRGRSEGMPFRQRRIYEDIEMRKKMTHLGEFLGYDGLPGVKMMEQTVRKWYHV